MFEMSIYLFQIMFRMTYLNNIGIDHDDTYWPFINYVVSKSPNDNFSGTGCLHLLITCNNHQLRRSSSIRTISLGQVVE